MGVIRAERLTKYFGASRALEDLDLDVERGEVFGFLGPNGAGKTTTIRLLLGLIRPTSGRAEVLGLDPQRDSVAIHRRIAYVPGEASLWPGLTGAETLHLLGRLHGSVDDAYRAELVEQFELDTAKRVRAYSKGNRQKLCLVAALMTRADLLVLDEPTAGLDPLMEQSFRACIREAQARGQSVFLSSHLLAEVESLCGRVAILRAGRLVEMGSLNSMRLRSALTLEASFDAGDVPDVTTLDGVVDARVRDGTLVCRVEGAVAPVLSVLAAAGVTRVVSREPTLEELFLTYYGGSSAAAGDDDGPGSGMLRQGGESGEL